MYLPTVSKVSLPVMTPTTLTVTAIVATAIEVAITAAATVAAVVVATAAPIAIAAAVGLLESPATAEPGGLPMGAELPQWEGEGHPDEAPGIPWVANAGWAGEIGSIASAARNVLVAEATAATSRRRGAAEIKLYALVSPSVVLIIGDGSIGSGGGGAGTQVRQRPTSQTRSPHSELETQLRQLPSSGAQI